MKSVLVAQIPKVRRHPFWAAGLVFVVALACLSLPFGRIFVINTTASLPRGLYVRSGGSPAVGRVIEFRVPDAVRNNLTSSVNFIIKPVVAVAGDEVDTSDGRVHVNGRLISDSVLMRNDSAARPLVQWRERRRLREGEYFVLSTRIPNSLDSRYFGPVEAGDILAVRRCVWQWDR